MSHAAPASDDVDRHSTDRQRYGYSSTPQGATETTWLVGMTSGGGDSVGVMSVPRQGASFTFPGPLRFREFSDLSDRAGQVRSVGTRAVRRHASIGHEPVPPHEVEPPSYVRCCSRPI